jgi:hypothetical protein
MKYHRSYLLLMALSFLFASMACSLGGLAATKTATPTEPSVSTSTPAVELGEEKLIEDQGFSFRPLPNYQLDTSMGVQMLGPKANPDTGPAFMLVGGVSAEGTTAESLIASLKSAEIEVGDQKPIRINGITGLSAEIRRPTGDLSGRVVAVMVKQNQQFSMFAIAPKAQWDREIAQLFEVVLGSVKFIELKAQAEATPVVRATSTAAASAATPSIETGTPPAGFSWRTGGASGFDENVFVTMAGMDASPKNLLYLADGMRGVWVLNPEGKVLATINDVDMSQPADVQIGPDGNVYVAAWGSHAVFVFSPDGKLLRRFGKEGKGDGQFGQFSPTDISVGPDGRVYVYDENKDNADKPVYRIQVFTPQGEWVKTFPAKDEWAAPDGMEFGPDGILYTVSFIDREITRYDANGKLLGTLKTDSLSEYVGAQDMDIDAAGNFYIAMWGHGVLKLDPAGQVIARWGVDTTEEIEKQSWPEGTSYRPAGVAVLRDGSLVAFSDSSGYFAYVTGFTFSGGNSAPQGASHQWAASAKASSEYGSNSWAARQATGAPNVVACGDNGLAWASLGTNTVDWLELRYENPVPPGGVNIYQTYNPGQIVKVELLDTGGKYHEIYNAQTVKSSQCSAVLEIKVQNADYTAEAVKITVDQSALKSWAEIDAVELVGTEAEGSAFSPNTVILDQKSGLPVMAGAQELYATDLLMNYAVETDLTSARQFYMTELPKLGWLLDLDDKGKCRDNERCMGWHAGYIDPKTTTFFFLQGEHAYLTLNLLEKGGQINVVATIDPAYK